MISAGIVQCEEPAHLSNVDRLSTSKCDDEIGLVLNADCLDAFDFFHRGFPTELYAVDFEVMK